MPGYSRRTFLNLLAITGLSSPTWAQAPKLITPEAQASIQRGLLWLTGRQHENGSFGSVSRYRENVGVTALCGLALLSSGSTPARGPHGGALTRGIDYLLHCCTPTGYIIENQSEAESPMYGHGFATMFLAEALGMSDREDLAKAVRKAVALIIQTQNDEGGWRYFPTPKEADISVTVCQLMALRAARNTGISVPKETIDRGVDYIQRCQNPDGGFRYRLFESQESRFARSAAAVAALYTSGVHEGPVLDKGRAYLRRFLPGPRVMAESDFHQYGHYYAVQAAWHAGGDYWDTWYPAIRQELIREQSPDGSWHDIWIGNEYGTAMALIVLQTPNHLLPIFDR
ncbi:MAG: prenyltransferase [Planctomycetota bacterium]|nr:MAG: prenyltransferase [Planctomycetota bacterium]